MAITKIHPIKVNLKAALDYIENPDKTDDKMLVSTLRAYVGLPAFCLCCSVNFKD